MFSRWVSLPNIDAWAKTPQLRWLYLLLLVVVGFFAFFHNIDLSLYGCTEGLYASVTREMLRTQRFLHPTYFGHVYNNKPPLFFWIQALSTSLFGENEFALRLPAACFSLGTMALTYQLGKTLFSRTAGLWASMVVATTYVFLWHGRMAIIDPALTFFMTLALLAWTQGYFRPSRSWWYVLSFLAMALATMLKALHAFVLPALLILVFLITQRDLRTANVRPIMFGFILSCALVSTYYWSLGSEFAQRFLVLENLSRIFGSLDPGNTVEASRTEPVYWYLLMMGFDFFPWWFLLPPSVILLFSHRPLRKHPKELFVLLWCVVYFLALSVVPEKHERYLMPIVPGFGLLIGYYYHAVFTSSEQKEWATLPFKLMLGLLSVVYIVVMFLAPFLLHRKWHVPTSVFPHIYVVTMIGFCGVLLYSLIRSKVRLALTTVGILAFGFLAGVTHLVIPAIDQVASPRLLVAETKTFLKSPQDPILVYGSLSWRSDEDLYYQFFEHSGVRLITKEELEDVVHEAGQTVLLTEKQYVTELRLAQKLSFDILREFRRPNRQILLVSIKRNQ
ncbi:MAG: ArnT family glycosyltransferase [Candidatus Methylomirabilales bacterium]